MITATILICLPKLVKLNISDHVEDEKRRMWTFTKPKWFEAAQEEYWACKERVCLMDMSSFAKFELEV